MPVSEPSKYTILWAQSGIRFDIPAAADLVTGKAGFDVGFSSINMASEAAGGIPPWGQDFNGIFHSLTSAAQYTQSGGLPTFSNDLAAAIGGYGKGAILGGADGVTIWQNITDGNFDNPDLGGSGWVDAVLKILPKRSFSENDYIRIPDVPGGLIVQWFSAQSANMTTTSITLPVAFPSKILHVSASGYNVSGGVQTTVTCNSPGLSKSFVEFNAFFADTPGEVLDLAKANEVRIQGIAIGV